MIEKVRTPAAGVHPLFRRGPAARLSAAGRGASGGGHRRRSFPEPKKLGQQLKYADRRGFRLALIAGEDEFAAGNVQIKDLATGQSETVPLAGVPRP